MMRIVFVCYVIILYAIGYWCAEMVVKQERAVVKYANPKYIRDVVVFTGRTSRRDPYRTNITGTTLVPYGNNVSFGLVLRMKTGGDFRVGAKACDTLKSKWMHEFMVNFTNIDQNICPIPPGTYKYMNMELPPKNIPLPMLDGDYYIIMELFVTATKEKILEICTLLHVTKLRKG